MEGSFSDTFASKECVKPQKICQASQFWSWH